MSVYRSYQTASTNQPTLLGWFVVTFLGFFFAGLILLIITRWYIRESVREGIRGYNETIKIYQKNKMKNNFSEPEK